jgi:hypothetical protein
VPRNGNQVMARANLQRSNSHRFARNQYNRNGRPQKFEPRSRELTGAGVVIGPKQHDLKPQLGLSFGCEASGPSKAARVAAWQTSQRVDM